MSALRQRGDDDCGRRVRPAVEGKKEREERGWVRFNPERTEEDAV